MVLTFGEKLKNLREDADLSQTTLAQHLNMTQRKVSYLECGKYEPSLDDIRIICRFFHVSSDYLLGLTNQIES